jgi:hypothetical protein
MKSAVSLLALIMASAANAGTVDLFINIAAPPGFSLIGTPFVRGNNLLSDLFPSVPFGTGVFTWQTNAFQMNLFTQLGWEPPDAKVLPGKAAFFHNILSDGIPITLHGQLQSGASLTNFIPAGFSALAPLLPSAGGVSTNLKLPLSPFDNVYLWKTNHFVVFTFLPTGKWNPQEPQVVAGEGFFVNKATPTNWVTTLP